MIPLPFLPILRTLPWRLIGIGVAAAAVALLAWRVTVWRGGYLERDEAVKALAAEKEAAKAQIQRYTDEIARSETQRQALQADLAKLRQRFAAMKVPPASDLTVPVEVPIEAGQTSCPDPRISPEFLRVFNAAGSP